MPMKKTFTCFSNEMVSEVLEEYVEYDRVADFIELVQTHPMADWYNAYVLYRKAKRNHIIMNETWSRVFRTLRGKDKPLSCNDLLAV